LPSGAVKALRSYDYRESAQTKLFP